MTDYYNKDLPLCIDYDNNEFRQKYKIKKDTIKDRLNNDIIKDFFDVSSKNFKSHNFENLIFQYDVADLLAIIFNYGINMPEIQKEEDDYFENKQRKVYFSNIFEYNKLLIEEIDKVNPVAKYLIQSTDEYEYAYSMTHFLSEIIDKIKLLICLSFEADTTKDKSNMLNKLNNSLTNIIDECLINSSNEYNYIQTNTISKTYEYTDIRKNIKNAYELLLRRKNDDTYMGCYNDDIFYSIEALDTHEFDEKYDILIEEITESIEKINNDINLATKDNFDKVNILFKEIKKYYKKDPHMVSELERHLSSVAQGDLNNDDLDIKDENLYNSIKFYSNKNNTPTKEVRLNLRLNYEKLLKEKYNINLLKNKYEEFIKNFNLLYNYNIFNRNEYKEKLINLALNNYKNFNGYFDITSIMDNKIIYDSNTFTKYNTTMYLSNVTIKFYNNIIQYQNTSCTNKNTSIREILNKSFYIINNTYKIINFKNLVLKTPFITLDDAKNILNNYKNIEIADININKFTIYNTINNILTFNYICEKINVKFLDNNALNYYVNTEDIIFSNFNKKETNLLTLYELVRTNYISLTMLSYYIYSYEEAELMVSQREKLELSRNKKLKDYKNKQNKLYSEVNKNIDRAVGLIWSDLNKI